MTQKKGTKKSKKTSSGKGLCCSLPVVQERDLSHIADGARMRMIAVMGKMWVNGTNLPFYFMKSPSHWRGDNKQKQAVRDAFNTWKNLGIGLTFQEVDDPADAKIRIGFDQTDGSWSYVGRDCVDYANDPSQRTMNFGWDLTTPYGRDTALHEIGHAIGFPHEHQNPLAGIIWDEDKVYENFSGPPNNWPHDTIHWNIIRKIPHDTVDGSDWDKDSIMHYEFDAGLIIQPEEYQDHPLVPAAGLSPLDIETVIRLYPPLEKKIPELRAFESQPFRIAAGEQVNFIIRPEISREYTIQTFGKMDTVMVLFENRDGQTEYINGDDDSGVDCNAKIVARLARKREYTVRTRLYYAQSEGGGAIMLY